jgi:hypothetical protein
MAIFGGLLPPSLLPPAEYPFLLFPFVVGAALRFGPRGGKGAGEWQTYDITLVGRMVTVVLNGKQVICRMNIPGPTGGALDSHEEKPGPIMLQGDHGPVEYRNLTITPAR